MRGKPIWYNLLFAGLILAVSLSAKLATSFGVFDDTDLTQRATMAMLGAFFMFTGNAMPKTLTPLSALRCDAAKAQACQRFTGWTWVLTGLAFSLVWLTLPIDMAEPVSISLLIGGMLLTATRLIRARRTRRSEA